MDSNKNQTGKDVISVNIKEVGILKTGRVLSEGVEVDQMPKMDKDVEITVTVEKAEESRTFDIFLVKPHHKKHEENNKKKNKILIFYSNADRDNLLNLDEEVRIIQKGLLQGKNSDQFQIRLCPATRFDDLIENLLDFEPHIVHFSGHGQKEGIIVTDKNGLPQPISIPVLSKLFIKCAGHIECVILNACFSAEQADEIIKYIPFVIGIEKKFPDVAAIDFSIGFYTALGAGKSLEDAFKIGLIRIFQDFPNLDTQQIPVLKKNNQLIQQRKG